MRGESWTLPAELKQVAKEAAREHELSDPWEEPVMNFVEGQERICVDDVLSNALKIEIDRQDRSSQMRVTNLLKANGWTTSREYFQGRRKRFWFSPSFNKTGCPGCPIEDETQTAVVGQPLGQPLGQPTGQPTGQPHKKNLQSDVPEVVPEVVHLEQTEFQPLRDNQDNQLPIKVDDHDLLYADHREPSIEPDDSKLSIGDKVEIRKSGQFYGKQAIVQKVLARNYVKVQGKDWVVTQNFHFSDLKLIERAAGGMSHADE